MSKRRYTPNPPGEVTDPADLQQTRYFKVEKPIPLNAEEERAIKRFERQIQSVRKTIARNTSPTVRERTLAHNREKKRIAKEGRNLIIRGGPYTSDEKETLDAWISTQRECKDDS
jgi:hypothetical protein